MKSKLTLLIIAILAITSLSACSKSKESKSQEKELTIYSGRSLEYYEPLAEEFEKETGIKLNIREGDSAELASQIITEGDATKADIFFGQDGGSLDALAQKKLFSKLSSSTLNKVDKRFRSDSGLWIGTSARVRVLAYSTKVFTEDKMNLLPQSLEDMVNPKFKGKIAFAPTNGSFQSFVTGMRLKLGEKNAKEWLLDFKANEPKAYEKNSAIVEAINKGEISMGLVNNYYIYEVANELGVDNIAVANKYYQNSVASMLNTSGIGILKSSNEKTNAQKFINYILSKKSQNYFAQTIGEYPTIAEVKSKEALPSLKELDPPNIDLSDLGSVQKTLDLLDEVGLLTK